MYIWLWIDNSHPMKQYVGVWQMEELIRTRPDHIDVPSLASNRNTVTMCPTGHMAVIQCNAESFVRIWLLDNLRLRLLDWLVKSLFMLKFRLLKCQKFFIGPRSDHSLPMSVTHWLTYSLTTLLKIEWIDLNVQTLQTMSLLSNIRKVKVPG